ncbi:PD-(D/E)XK nuclease family protein [Candidatus Falkowbacteria bacterium]|uniref:PD-(D/E)XK endonuclease-like domain-containing protein n=1 Tax=Candidatus Buchananbacteria bacterium CG10_big_fil_rev_8_21_14_0_10_33_19 TaxID=1974525 RepID=A0A2H0W323_9BACT|nr:PD-(D/E)XK nuclease family protein [Candidatus Falkowbacteria bacterium]PIS05763.1 MAG: hypothetical protein COT80_03255 [Candidatus Buchananbacteria bacterium CG10_big_fil_rev_8_21_14_0_10_33_19]
MAQDKYTATWVSHSSISDFLKCPQAYFLKNVYKDPKTGHKIQLMTPPLALGQAVHNVLESLSAINKTDRFSKPLSVMFESEWQKISGDKGGFLNEKHEHYYKNRGLAMLNNVYNNPGPLANLAIKIKQDLPQFWLSEEDNIILCGKIDWLEYFPDTDTVHIIDFKTGKVKEDPNSLQLPIYHLLVDKCQERKATRASYWYLEHNKTCTEKELPSLEEARLQVLTIARKIKLARQLKKFDCLEGDCAACHDIKKVVAGEAKFVGYDGFRDVYIIDSGDLEDGESQSDIL